MRGTGNWISTLDSVAFLKKPILGMAALNGVISLKRHRATTHPRLSPDSPERLAARGRSLPNTPRSWASTCFQNFEPGSQTCRIQRTPQRLVAGTGGWKSPAVAVCALDSVDYPDAADKNGFMYARRFAAFGLGRQLAEMILDRGRMAGYQSVLLDTERHGVRQLYSDLGFEDIHLLYHNPWQAPLSEGRFMSGISSKNKPARLADF
jgi:GNAT superfamily N-acetyltransferase